MSTDSKRWLQLVVYVIAGGYIVGAVVGSLVGTVLVYAEWASAATEVE